MTKLQMVPSVRLEGPPSLDVEAGGRIIKLSSLMHTALARQRTVGRERDKLPACPINPLRG
jgi:hypothetical protein